MQRASCLSCHRRKLKCSREDTGCSNCRKGDKECEYPAAEARTRGKRGPYQKRASKDELDLAQELKATEARYKQLASQIGKEQQQSQANYASTSSTSVQGEHSHSPGIIDNQSPGTFDSPVCPLNLDMQQTHPPLDQMYQLWHAFVTRVDPVTKLVHRPSLEKRIFTAKASIHTTDESLPTLMYCIYYAAVVSTTAKDAQLRFGESKNVLADRFQEAIEKSLALAHMSNTPDFMMLQALVIYIVSHVVLRFPDFTKHGQVSLKRQDSTYRLWPLFGLAVRMAQLLDIGKDEQTPNLSPLETELRKRIWWTLCWLEKQCAEDLATQKASIMTWFICSFPLNINDDDLDPDSSEMPQPRSGITDMTFCLMRIESLKLFFDLSSLKASAAGKDSAQKRASLAHKKERMYFDAKSRLETLYLSHCSDTRPFDWLIIKFVGVLLAKAEVMARKPAMSENDVFHLSFVILRNTYQLQTEPKADLWSWIFRDFVQSHALIKVVSEMCKGKGSSVDPASMSEAWVFIDRVVDRIPLVKRQDPTVSPIITLMGLARHSRASSISSQSSAVYHHVMPAQSLQAFPLGQSTNIPPLQAFPDAWTENAISWSSDFLAAAITTPESIVNSDLGFTTPAADVVGGAGLSITDSVAGLWASPELQIMDPTLNNVDWGQWDRSMDVFNTTFGPG